MRTCGDECYPLCNHCVHVGGKVQDWKGRWCYPKEGGRCMLTGEVVDPCHVCDDFECCLLDKKKGKSA
jgi:hypothetical protein